MCSRVAFSNNKLRKLIQQSETHNLIRCEELGYGLDDRGSRVRFPAGAGNFSLHYSVQNGSGAHPAFYPMGNRRLFPWG
jgi:hypothetical protein